MCYFIAKHYQETLSKNHASIGIVTINESHGPIFSIVLSLKKNVLTACILEENEKKPQSLTSHGCSGKVIPFGLSLIPNIKQFNAEAYVLIVSETC